MRAVILELLRIPKYFIYCFRVAQTVEPAKPKVVVYFVRYTQWSSLIAKLLGY